MRRILWTVGLKRRPLPFSLLPALLEMGGLIMSSLVDSDARPVGNDASESVLCDTDSSESFKYCHYVRNYVDNGI